MWTVWSPRCARPGCPPRSCSPRSTSPPCRWRCCCGWPASPYVAAVSEDYPGSLLDVRHRVDDDLPEAGARTVHSGRRRVRPAGRRRRPAAGPDAAAGGVAPDRRRPVRGACTPARPCRPGPGRRHGPRPAVEALTAAGRRVVVTGGPGEAALTAAVAGRRHRPRRPDRLRRAGRGARRRGRRRGRQHRPGAPRRGGRHPGRLAVRAGRAGRPVGPVRGGRRAARRPGRALPGQPGHRLPGARPPLPGLGDPAGRGRRRGQAGGWASGRLAARGSGT